MATVTRPKLGPRDHGREITDDESVSASYLPGYKYEIIDGRVYVSPAPNQPHDWLEDYCYWQLKLYALQRPNVINEVRNKARVFVPGVTRTTSPEPDIAAYADYPLELGPDVRWQDVSPVIVVEVMTREADPRKDLVRNVDLYLRVPSIQEYWLIDIRKDPRRPRMTAHFRVASQWRKKPVAFGKTYTTRLLPGFALVLDPRSRV
jgi:Uma2 family endonuclease